MRIGGSKSVVYERSKDWSLPLVLLLVFGGQILVGGVGPLSERIALSSSWDEFVIYPWTILTYGYVHASVSHFLTIFLLLVYLLYFFHYPSRYVPFFLFVVGTLTGGALFLLFSSAFVPDGSTLVGGSAGVCALVPYAVVSIIRYKKSWSEVMLKAMPLVGMLILDVLALYNQSNWGILAHIGGYMSGVISLLIVHYLSNCKKLEAQEQSAQWRAAILEKVKRSGYSSLSRQERAIIDDMR